VTFKNVVLLGSSGVNILPIEFVYSIKHGDGREIYKAGFVNGGHRDQRKNHFVHTAPSLSHTSVRLLLAIASTFGGNLWAEDVKLARLEMSCHVFRAHVFSRNMCFSTDWN
jgi:hypothetical protein